MKRKSELQLIDELLEMMSKDLYHDELRYETYVKAEGLRARIAKPLDNGYLE